MCWVVCGCVRSGKGLGGRGERAKNLGEGAGFRARSCPGHPVIGVPTLDTSRHSVSMSLIQRTVPNVWANLDNTSQNKPLFLDQAPKNTTSTFLITPVPTAAFQACGTFLPR